MIKHSKFTIHYLLCFIALLLLANYSPALAQDFPTSTPDAEGNIFVVVQPNDSLWAIAARAGIPLTELLALNNLAEDSIIAPGDVLLIGRVVASAANRNCYAARADCHSSAAAAHSNGRSPTPYRHLPEGLCGLEPGWST